MSVSKEVAEKILDSILSNEKLIKKIFKLSDYMAKSNKIEHPKLKETVDYMRIYQYLNRNNSVFYVKYKNGESIKYDMKDLKEIVIPILKPPKKKRRRRSKKDIGENNV